ncbi:MAG: hypothetical protein ACE5GV_11620 [Candidatus Scalindua sp.]
MNTRKVRTKAEQRKRLLQIAERREKLTEQLNLLSELDPYWMYQPSDGIINDRGKEFLQKYLREEDIPQRLDSQLDAHLSTANIIGVTGGNQAGKTTFLAIEDYIAITGELPLALKGKYPKSKLPTSWPVKIRVVGVSDKQVNNTVKYWYQYWCPKQHLKNGKWSDSYSSQYDVLTLYSNSKGEKVIGTIEFMNNKQDVEVFQGPPLHKVSYDEEPLESIRKENIRRFVTADQVREVYAFTPTKGLSWTASLFLDCNDNDRSIERFQLCSVINPKANLKSLAAICNEETDYDVQKMRLLGEFISLSGLVYGKLFDNRIHVIPPFALNKKDYVVYRGLDPHLVKPTVCVEIAIDRMGFEYVVGTYSRQADTSEIKKDLAVRAVERNYRLGWTRCDKSADSTIKALGDRNIFLELGRGENAIPALDTSEKYTGSIHAGVDVIKRLLKVDPIVGKPRLFVFNIPENKQLITAFKTMERDVYSNEDKKGIKDRIAEGRHDAHAALRYAHQRHMNWIPIMKNIPEYKPISQAVGY